MVFYNLANLNAGMFPVFPVFDKKMKKFLHRDSIAYKVNALHCTEMKFFI